MATTHDSVSELGRTEHGVPCRLKNIGAIEDCQFVAPAEGGIVRFRGGMETGKSTALAAMAYAADRDSQKPPVRDGADFGEIQVGDVLIRVGKRCTRTGELEFEILTGRYTIADLIDPGFKDRASCDEHAIKFLAQLAGSGDASLFYDLVGGQAEFEKLIPLEVAGSLDVVALAGKVERALQSLARTEESHATAADAKAEALVQATREIDVSAEHDEVKLAEARDKAVTHGAELRQKASNATARKEEAATARDALEDAQAEFKGPSVAEAKAALATAEELERNARELFNEAERLLDERQRALSQRSQEANAAARELEHARANEALVEKFRQTVAAAENVELVSEEELAAASQAVNAAKEAEAKGVLIRKALADRTTADEWRRKAADHRRAAMSYRDCAAGTDDVLSSLVAKLGSDLFVKSGKLLIKSPHRELGHESYWELSDGRRAELAISIVTEALRKRGHRPWLSIPQPYWEGLAWDARQRLVDLFRNAKATGFVAQVDTDQDTAGPLRAEVLTG